MSRLANIYIKKSYLLMILVSISLQMPHRYLRCRNRAHSVPTGNRMSLMIVMKVIMMVRSGKKACLFCILIIYFHVLQLHHV
jgi:hypothetical protein